MIVGRWAQLLLLQLLLLQHGGQDREQLWWGLSHELKQRCMHCIL